jgi:hypothetical protein
MLRASATVLLSAGLLLTAGCGGSSTSSTGGAASGTTKRIAITVKDGKVTPATHREKLSTGTKVRLQVTSDHDDEIHVHGYNLMKDIDAGKPGTIAFVANQSGIFEVELEDEGLQLIQLQVQ